MEPQLGAWCAPMWQRLRSHRSGGIASQRRPPVLREQRPRRSGRRCRFTSLSKILERSARDAEARPLWDQALALLDRPGRDAGSDMTKLVLKACLLQRLDRNGKRRPQIFRTPRPGPSLCATRLAVAGCRKCVALAQQLAAHRQLQQPEAEPSGPLEIVDVMLVLKLGGLGK